MAKELEPFDVTDTSDTLRLAEEVASTGVPRVLRRGGEELAIIRPMASTARKSSRSRSSRPTSPNAWVEGLIGIVASADPVDVSANIHEYIADATEGNSPTPR